MPEKPTPYAGAPTPDNPKHVIDLALWGDDPYENVAEWLVEQCAYPFDWSTPKNPPPVPLQKAVEDAWVRRDGSNDPEDEAVIRRNVAEEGGWYQP